MVVQPPKWGLANGSEDHKGDAFSWLPAKEFRSQNPKDLTAPEGQLCDPKDMIANWRWLHE